MQCELVFYVAHKTGHNHGVFNEKLSNTEFKVTKTMVATSPVDLGEQLKSSLKRSNLIFIIGGLLRDDETNIVDILSKSLESNSKGKINCKRIENANGSCDGYIVESGLQMIVMLPDTPSELNVMTGSVLMKYISDFYGLKYSKKLPKKNNVAFKAVTDSDAFYEAITNNVSSYNSQEEEPPKSLTDKVSTAGVKLMVIILSVLGILALSFIVVYFLYYIVISRMSLGE